MKSVAVAPVLASTRRQFRPLGVIAAVLFVPIVGGMLAAQWVADRRGISLAMFTRDPATALHGKYWVGFISNIGVILWSVTAVVCVYTSILLRNTPQRQWRWFFLCAGLLTGALMIDDCFMLHDGMLWAVARIPEKVVLGTWGISGIAWLVVYRQTILKNTDFIVLLAACGFFGLSLMADMEMLNIADRHRHLVEDGSKLLGIVAWGAYFCRSACGVLRAAIITGPAEAAESQPETGDYAMPDLAAGRFAGNRAA